MGELLFCNEPIAAMPYYIESVSLNIYSIEELCYYISTNVFLLDKGFMNEELCTWVEKEAHLAKTAICMREIMHSGGKLSDFVAQIIEVSGYCTKSEIQEINSVLKQLEEKSDFECIKLRADKLMERQRYLNAIFEYRRLLDKEETKSEDVKLVGNIWHNLGTAYGRLFLFEEAVECYETAYVFNENRESLKECLFACRCLHDDEEFERIADKYHVGDMEVCEIRNELSIASRGEKIVDFEQRIEQIEAKRVEDKIGYQKEISRLIFEWKENYRKICRI